MEVHRAVPPQMWGITRHQLEQFEQEVRGYWKQGRIPKSKDEPGRDHHDTLAGPSIYQVCEHFVKPITKAAGGMSYALMLEPRGLHCDVFVSHAWAEGVFEFLRRVLKSWPRGAKGLWCAFLSCPQDWGGELMGDGVLRSPFAAAIATSRCLLLVAGSREDVFGRLWCAVEAKMAFDKQVDIQVYRPSVPPAQVLYAASPGVAAIMTALSATYGVVQYFQGGNWMIFVASVLGPALAAAFLNKRFESPAGTRNWTTLSVLLGFAVGFLFLKMLVTMCVHTIDVIDNLDDKCSHGDLEAMITTPEPEGYVAGQFTNRLWHSLDLRVRTLLVSCLLALSLQLLALQRILSVTRAAMHAEESMGHKHYVSVAEALCTNLEDQKRLRADLAGKEAETDDVLNALRALGRYDLAVRDDVAAGFDPVAGRVVGGRSLGRVGFYEVFGCCCLWGLLEDVAYDFPPRCWKVARISTVWYLVSVTLPAIIVLAAVAIHRPRERAAATASKAVWFAGFARLAVVLLTALLPALRQHAAVHAVHELLELWAVSRALVGPRGPGYAVAVARGRQALALGFWAAYLTAIAVSTWLLASPAACRTSCSADEQVDCACYDGCLGERGAELLGVTLGWPLLWVAVGVWAGGQFLEARHLDSSGRKVSTEEAIELGHITSPEGNKDAAIPTVGAAVTTPATAAAAAAAATGAADDGPKQPLRQKRAGGKEDGNASSDESEFWDGGSFCSCDSAGHVRSA